MAGKSMFLLLEIRKFFIKSVLLLFKLGFLSVEICATLRVTFPVLGQGFDIGLMVGDALIISFFKLAILFPELLKLFLFYFFFACFFAE